MASARTLLLGFILLWAQLIAAAPTTGPNFLRSFLRNHDNRHGNSQGRETLNTDATHTQSAITTPIPSVVRDVPDGELNSPGAGGAPAAQPGTPGGLPIINPDVADQIPNRYIVVYDEDFDDEAIDARISAFSAALKKRNLNKRASDGRPMSTELKAMRLNKMRFTSLDADDQMIKDINDAKEVKYVEIDHYVTTRATIAQTNAPPGLVALSASGGAEYLFDESAGEGITAYVVDTGVRVTHSEFEGRATFAANFVDNQDDDLNGHGSHVAGTIAGATFGVAKKANIKAVKVLDANGQGRNSDILDGMQFVMNDVTQNNLKGKAIMNMSLGGSLSVALNRAVEALTNYGIVPVVAAGNENEDATNSSPASAAKAITVGAIDARTNARADFSNFGQPVDIFAPGVGILSVGIRSDTDTKVLSGTSMACPHVAGLAATLMAQNKNLTTTAAVDQMLKDLAQQSTKRVQNNVGGTTSLIATNGIR